MENELIERPFQREGPSYLSCINRHAFLTSEYQKKKYHARSCQNEYDTLTFCGITFLYDLALKCIEPF